MFKFLISLLLGVSVAYPQSTIGGGSLSGTSIYSSTPPSWSNEFNSIYTDEIVRMMKFDTQINTAGPIVHNFQPTLFGGELLVASTYYNLTSANYYTNSITPQLNAFQAMGVQVVKFKVDTPILIPYFYTNWLNGAGASHCTINCSGNSAAAMTAIYAQILADCHARNIKVDMQTVVSPEGGSGSTGDPWDLQDFYATLVTTGCPNTTTCQYEMFRLQQTVAVLALHPDFMTLVAEPSNEGQKSGQHWLDPVYTVAPTWYQNEIQMISDIAANLETVGDPALHTTTLTSMGEVSADPLANFNAFINGLVVIHSDLCEIHVHPINLNGGNVDYLQNIIVEANLCIANGKGVALNEQNGYWETTPELSTLSVHDLEARNNIDAFTLLDQWFIKFHVDFARNYGVRYISFSTPEEWFANLHYTGTGSCVTPPYIQTNNCSAGQWDTLELTAYAAAVATTPITVISNGNAFLKYTHVKDTKSIVAAAAPYSSGLLLSQPVVAQWLTNHFGFLNNATSNLVGYFSFNTNFWPSYNNSTVVNVPSLYAFKNDVATTNSFTPENMLLHFNQDYFVGNNFQPNHMDQFDYFEQSNPLQAGSGNYTNAINGAFLLNGTTYTDVTGSPSNNIYDGTFSNTITDKLLLGYAEPFAQINLTIPTAISGGTVVWQYTTGTNTWATLALVTDGTNQLRNTGTNTIMFTPPSNWVPSVINGSRSKYWVRLVVSGQTVSPIISKATGDNWLASGAFNCRGWSTTDVNRVNVGLGNLEYNPNPPTNATAHFRYQSRVTGIGGPDTNMWNPYNVQNTKNTTATALLAENIANVGVTGFAFNGTYFDSGGLLPTVTNPANFSTAGTFEQMLFPDLPSGTTYEQAFVNNMSVTRTNFKTYYGTGFKTAINAINNDTVIAHTQDYSESETWANVPRIGNIASNFSFLDSFNVKALTNLLNTKQVLQFMDNHGYFGDQDTEVNNGSTVTLNYPWDMVNRSSLLTLAAYYMGSNINTLMAYNAFGLSYNTTDEAYQFLNTGTPTISTSLSVDTSNSTKTFTTTNDTNITTVGGPFDPTNSTYALRLGGYDSTNSNIVNATKTGSHTWTTTSPIFKAVASGAPVEFGQMFHQSSVASPLYTKMWFWGNYFPAMNIDIGPPDGNGWNMGQRDIGYISSGAGASGLSPTVCSTSGCGGWWRRDFRDAIVLIHEFENGDAVNDLITFGPTTPITFSSPNFSQTKYYPLLANGLTGSGITSLQLRAGEAAILMKQPR